MKSDERMSERARPLVAEVVPRRAKLIPRTDEAHRALGRAEVVIVTLPLNVGRECRTALMKLSSSMDRRLGGTSQVNDIYLVDPTPPYRVSREHFLIDFAQGQFVLTDRGSVGGTTVNGTTLGGDRRGGHTDLHDHDEIVVGDATSPFVFVFQVG
jgi:hypothetical protein